MECTIKETRGELKTERQIAFANALKAIDEDKELNEMYENALREIGRDLFDMTDEEMSYNQTDGWWPYVIKTPNDMYYAGYGGGKDGTEQPYRRWQPSQYKETSLYPYIEEFGWENLEKIMLTDGLTREEALQWEDRLICMYRKLGCCINKQRSGCISKDKKEYTKQYNQNHKEEKSQYRKIHKEEESKRRKQYYQDHKEELLEKEKQYYQDNKDCINEYKKKYYQEHKKEILERKKQRYQCKKKMQNGGLNNEVKSVENAKS